MIFLRILHAGTPLRISCRRIRLSQHCEIPRVIRMKKSLTLFVRWEAKSSLILRLFPGMRQKGNTSSVKSGELLFFLIDAAEEICLQLVLESWRHINGIPWPTQSTIRGKNLPIETMNLMNVADIIAAMGSGQWKDMKVSISTGNGFSPFSMRQTVSFATI